MKNLILLIILFSLYSCNQKSRIKNSRIEKFEKLLGKQETKFRNEIIADFDTFLDSKYPTENLKFKQYLVDISESTINDYWKIM